MIIGHSYHGDPAKQELLRMSSDPEIARVILLNVRGVKTYMYRL